MYKYVYSLVLLINEIREFLLSIHGIKARKRLELGFCRVINSGDPSGDHVSLQLRQSHNKNLHKQPSSSDDPPISGNLGPANFFGDIFSRWRPLHQRLRRLLFLLVQPHLKTIIHGATFLLDAESHAAACEDAWSTIPPRIATPSLATR